MEGLVEDGEPKLEMRLARVFKRAGISEGRLGRGRAWLAGGRELAKITSSMSPYCTSLSLFGRSTPFRSREILLLLASF